MNINISSGNNRLSFTRQGAHLTSWECNNEEQLFLSQDARFEPGVAIRGGVPICFPQFGAFGPGKKHGFARNIDWTLVSQTQHSACFQLESDTDTLAMWPYEFSATYTAEVTGDSLTLTLEVTNKSPTTIEFTAALHTYLRVNQIEHCIIEGLKGRQYWDNGHDFDQRSTQKEQPLKIHTAIDRVYFDTFGPLNLIEPARTREIKSENFSDTVIWNPWQEGATALSDMNNDEYQSMLCIESAAVQHPIVIAPQKTWKGSQTITVLQR
jgi:glucose-6-phosphate 1-epimerase